jgi:hypothetical protein
MSLMAVEPGELDRRLVGFSTGAVEEGVVHAGNLRELLAQLLLLDHPVDVRGVDDLGRLVCDCRDQPRVGVAQPVHGNARERVEISFARFIPQPCAFAAHERDRQSLVGVHQVSGHRSPPAGRW